MELNQLYHQTSEQTQNRLQEILRTFDFEYSELYNIADKKTKKRINTYIEEWQNKGLFINNRLSSTHSEINNLTQSDMTQFGLLANDIYKRTRVKNSEILMLLILSAYIEEQKKIEEIQNKIFKKDISYYYNQGQKEVDKDKVSGISDALFLYIMEQAGATGLNYNQYNEAIAKYNADQIYKQVIIDSMQQKTSEIDSDVYQNIIKKQNNARLCINDDKVSGSVETFLIGWNNQAKLEGILKNDIDAKVMFVAIEDENTTKMCQSLDRQIFNVKNWNEFKRYSQINGRITKYRCKGLVIGLNQPPIIDHFHYCRSTFVYVKDNRKINNIYFDNKENIISNGIKILSNKDLKKINRVALLRNLRKAEEVFKDFPILKSRNIKYKVVNENDNSAMAVRPTAKGGYILEINKNVFNKNIKKYYDLGTSQHDSPKGTNYEYIAVHEIGHMANFEIIRKNNKNDLTAMQFDYNNNITANNIVEKAFNNLKVYDIIQREKMVKSISNYALKDSSETIGEAFADYYCNKRNANLLSIEVLKVMKGMMKD